MDGRGDELPTFMSRLLESLAIFNYNLNIQDMQNAAGDGNHFHNNWQNIDNFGIADMDEEFVDLNGENDDVLVGGANIDDEVFDDPVDLNRENDDVLVGGANIDDEVFYDPVDLNGENDDVLVGGANIDDEVFYDPVDLNGENDDVLVGGADIDDEVFYDPVDLNGENDDVLVGVADIDDEVFYDPVDLNRENDDIAVAGGINNDNVYEAVEEAADVHQDIPEEDPLPGVSSGSTKRPREENVDDEAHTSKRIRLANPDLRTESDIAHEGAEEAADVHQDIPEEDPLPGVSSGSTKRPREENVDDEAHTSKRIRLANPDLRTESDIAHEGAEEAADVHQDIPEEDPLPGVSSGSTKRPREENVDDEAQEGSPPELDNHQVGGSRKKNKKKKKKKKKKKNKKNKKN
ncbi:uncharacterized protein LOC115793167 isoform X2 [Archocentrus centrarchus]|uniref:uncharacterized protein LOC115793167 isoform X2 n=1 Tax=Archocentrus centrarchus TaxID=63155 RepID=UPI0011EA16A7|nr:uncharacterized protein LOC115793167 isoform X2 [Archocentrus centrarchus]